MRNLVKYHNCRMLQRGNEVSDGHPLIRSLNRIVREAAVSHTDSFKGAGNEEHWTMLAGIFRTGGENIRAGRDYL